MDIMDTPLLSEDTKELRRTNVKMSQPPLASPLSISASNSDDISHLFKHLPTLSEFQQTVIRERYRLLMNEYLHRCRVMTVLFYTFRLTMTVGSLAVPALLSIQSVGDTPARNGVFWFTWGLSLAVTTANGILTLFKLDKRFFMLHATAERLRTETWQFIQLSGRYSGRHGKVRPTHANQYVYYCTQLEKINMKRVDDEFIKNADMEDPNAAHHPPPQNGQQAPSASALVPSPPDQATFIQERDSGVSVEDGLESIEDSETVVIKMPMPEQRPPLRQTGSSRNPLLPAAPSMPGVTVVGLRTDV